MRKPRKQARRKRLDLTLSRVRSAITNGSQVLNEVDHRSATMRRFRDIIHAHQADLGGEPVLSEGQKAIIRRAALLQLQLEMMEQKFALRDDGSAGNHRAARAHRLQVPLIPESVCKEFNKDIELMAEIAPRTPRSRRRRTAEGSKPNDRRIRTDGRTGGSVSRPGVEGRPLDQAPDRARRTRKLARHKPNMRVAPGKIATAIEADNTSSRGHALQNSAAFSRRFRARHRWGSPSRRWRLITPAASS